MSQLPPQTLSIKRKRTEAPVDALLFDHTVKRQKSQNLDAYLFRRLTKPNDAAQQSSTAPRSTIERRFRLDAVSRTGGKRVFVEDREKAESQYIASGGQVQAPIQEHTPQPAPPQPRKRPGASSALRRTTKPTPSRTPNVTEPSETDVRNLEALSKEVEKVDNLEIPLPSSSPSKHKPRAPTRRFADRHPEKAAALAQQDTTTNNHDEDAMDIDTDEYVYDTYIREAVPPNAPAPTGTVGLLILNPEDEDWWDGEETSDKEFDTDDEDENAEDYYANDYPEDEMSDDDEFGRNLYQSKYRRGSDDEDFDGAGSDDDVGIGSGEDEDDLHFKMTVPKAQRVGYWGVHGE